MTGGGDVGARLYPFISFVSSYELFSYLVDSIVGNANKASGAVRSVCRSAVALPISRAVGLHKSLVSPIALLNCIAWLLFLNRTVSGMPHSVTSGGSFLAFARVKKDISFCLG